MILSRRAEPPALILASRRSRRRRTCFWAADSPDVLSKFSILNFETKKKENKRASVMGGGG